MKTFKEFLSEWDDPIVPQIVTPFGDERDRRVKSKMHPRKPKPIDKEVQKKSAE